VVEKLIFFDSSINLFLLSHVSNFHHNKKGKERETKREREIFEESLMFGG
jgi:hypothetical protein